LRISQPTRPPPRLCLKMTQIFLVVGILLDPPFFSFVLKQRHRTGESLQRLLSAGTSDSRRAFASCCAPLLHPSCCPLWLVDVLPLVTPPPLVRLRLCLSMHCRLSLHPSRPSCPAGCCVASRHTAVSRLPAPPPLIAPPPIIAPLLCLLSDWLSRHLSSRCRLPSACVSASHHASCLAGCCVTSCRTAASASHCPAAAHCTPLAPLLWLVIASPLVTPPPPVRLHLRLSAHRCLIPHPCHDKRHESLTPLIRLVVVSPLVTRGGIDKNLRKIICPKIKFEVWKL
jgi:hypothetical protein